MKRKKTIWLIKLTVSKLKFRPIISVIEGYFSNNLKLISDLNWDLKKNVNFTNLLFLSLSKHQYFSCMATANVGTKVQLNKRKMHNESIQILMEDIGDFVAFKQLVTCLYNLHLVNNMTG